MILTINRDTGIVTSTDKSKLNIITQTAAHGWNGTFNSQQQLADISRVVIHYTGANVDGPSDMTLSGLNATWQHAGWVHGGYHFVIRTDGEVWQISRINRTSNGAAGQNGNTIHIALMGLFWDGESVRPRRNNGTQIGGITRPSENQQQALSKLVEGLLRNQNLSRITGLTHVFGHRHLPNQSTYCPGMTLENVRKLIRIEAREPNNEPPTSETPPPTRQTYVVQKGDTLFSIARQYNTTVLELQKLNRLGYSTLIRIGQMLYVTKEENKIHIVETGDTLFSLAQRYKITVQRIQQLNNLGNSNLIRINQRLIVS